MSAYTLWCEQHSDVGRTARWRSLAAILATETPEARAKRKRSLLSLARQLGREASKAQRPRRNDDFGNAEDWMHHTGEYDYTQLPGF